MGATAGEAGELAAGDEPSFMRSCSSACALFMASIWAPPPPGRPANDDDPMAGFRALPSMPSAVELGLRFAFSETDRSEGIRLGGSDFWGSLGEGGSLSGEARGSSSDGDVGSSVSGVAGGGSDELIVKGSVYGYRGGGSRITCRSQRGWFGRPRVKREKRRVRSSRIYRVGMCCCVRKSGSALLILLLKNRDYDSRCRPLTRAEGRVEKRSQAPSGRRAVVVRGAGRGRYAASAAAGACSGAVRCGAVQCAKK